MMKRFFLSLLLLTGLAPAQLSKPDTIVHSLESFGPINTPQEIQATWQAAHDAMKAQSGVIIVPTRIWSQLKPDALQSLTRIPKAPEPARTWRHAPGLAVLSADRERPNLHVPPLSGVGMLREFRLDAGDSAPHWGTHPMFTLDSKIIHGSSSYLDWIQAPTAPGDAARFYVPTVRGLWPGQFLNVHGHSGYGGGVNRAYVQSLGYDKERKQHYFVSKTGMDHKAAAIAHNKSNTGILHMIQTSNADNQTYDVKVIRNQYAHGDTYIYYCDFNYMSNIHSAAGDENGNCYGAFIRTLDKNFRSKVETVDWKSAQLTFNPSAEHVKSLGNSRPLINLNPEKHLTAGKVVIVTGRSDYDLPDPEMTRYAGTDYLTSLIVDPVTGVTVRKFGGLIRGDADCGWTEDVIGRFFAVDEASEKTPKGDHRWYLITKFIANADGTKDIEIERFWWGAKSAGHPTLYRPENYTWDGHVRPLAYRIAPGTYVNDVSRALAGGNRGGQRTLGLAPHAGQDTPFDFAPGDDIEQAIGPDPFKPEAFRVWMWEDVPGQYPAAVIDVANHGAASRYSVISMAGGPSNLDDVSKRHEPKPAWDNILVQNTAATVGFNLKADFANAAILFHQPNREQPIKWHYGMKNAAEEDPGKTGITKTVSAPAIVPQVASLTVNRGTGAFTFEGGGIQAGGPASGLTGLSGDTTPARNLRGKNIAVTAGDKTMQVRFPQAETDGDYAVFIEQSWLTNRAISDKTPEGFTVEFADAAPGNATLDWMLIR